MGASAGLLPCPSALVVLLAAIAQHQVALGLLMIVVFSLGLATTLSGLGIAVVSAGRLTQRLNLNVPSIVMRGAPGAVRGGDRRGRGDPYDQRGAATDGVTE